jgi:CRISPR-associated endonuclease/helicase Cas3
LKRDYTDYFRALAALPRGSAPHPWQAELAAESVCTNRLIRVPTGFGKTFGVVGAWLWNRIEQRRDDWPRRLVWCLPMRVLVEQVVAEAQAALAVLGGEAAGTAVHVVMGGVDAGEWHLSPEREAVLVGTQDMLLSRALNRGYGTKGRARWPMDFGLLNQDCLWVMDEVQLMDVGLATSAQLQAFREQDASAGKGCRPCKTWWMSATLQRKWVDASPDAVAHLAPLARTGIAAAQRRGLLWDGISKSMRVEAPAVPKKIATLAAETHAAAGCGAGGPTLVVVNRVRDAQSIYEALRARCAKDDALRQTDLRLIHSRFRPAERAAWRAAFLNRAACSGSVDRIIVATQVVEAGVDISAGVLITDLAPWPSLVQRFGRCARWGGAAQVIVVDSRPKDDKAAAPYRKDELDAAREALALLGDVAPVHLEAFEEEHPELIDRLYPYAPAHLLLRHELDELFDTTADLSGADIDISRFIRSGEERDLQVFWRDVANGETPAPAVRAARDELCAVPFLAARDWLCGEKGERLTAGVRAWVWDWIDGKWIVAERRSMYPGQLLLVAADVGGYDAERGWLAGSRAPVVPVTPQVGVEALGELADSSENDESLSVASGWQTIAFHGMHVGRHAKALAATLVPELADLFDLAGRWHDAGKVHPAFQACLKRHGKGAEIAKAPDDAWLRGAQLYRMPDGSQRRGFRHELASVLAIFALLRRCRPHHPGLLGPWRDLLQRLHGAEVLSAQPISEAVTPLERELIELDADRLDLFLYLVCSHHGKVRMAWHASPADQESRDSVLRIRGVRAGDVLPELTLYDERGNGHVLPPADLVLAPAAAGLNPYCGRGWTERVLGLLQRFGPFTLAWLEAVLRAADQRATRDASLVDPALDPHPPFAGVSLTGVSQPPRSSEEARA